jgi:AGZA family xanthine/uracil permease-like MFS transporter
VPTRSPLWTRGDLDGFFGLMVDNLVQVLLITALCTEVVHLPREFIFQRILPGVAVSLLIGNLFYGLQARYVARRYSNPNCTALPFGINTPSVFAYVLFIMGPVYADCVERLGKTSEAAADTAWRAGLLACLVSGVIELGGAFVAERLRRVTPRAALLGVLAAVGITFIAADFAFRIYTQPLVGVLPLAILLLAYFARYRFPLALPGGFLAILIGSAIAWGLATTTAASWTNDPPLMSAADVGAAWAQRGWVAPYFCGRELLEVLAQPEWLLRFLVVSIPMGVMNVLGSLQNIESAEAGGDRFATAPSLAVNGIGTICAGLFGSCFPTTIYIGHPGWKALGARSGYSILNGVFFTFLFLYGLGGFLTALIPITAGAAIVLYIGILIAAQAFQATPREHAPAVAIALFPAIAAIIYTTLASYLDAMNCATTLAGIIGQSPQDARTATLAGLLALTGANSSWLVVSLILAAVGVALIERRYRAAAIWCAAAAVLTFAGVMHAYRLEGNTIRELFLWQSVESGPASASAAAPSASRAYPIAIGYALATLVFVLAAWRERPRTASAAAALSSAAALPSVPDAHERLG